MYSLIIKQAVLSFVLPLSLLTLVMFVHHRDLMAVLILVRKSTTALDTIACVVILSLIIWLLHQAFATTLVSGFGWCNW